MPSAAPAQLSREGGAYWAQVGAPSSGRVRARCRRQARTRTGLEGEDGDSAARMPGPDAGVLRGAPIRGHAASDGSRPRDAPFTDSGGGGIPAGSGGLLVCHRSDDHHHLLGDRAAGQVVVLATQGENNGGTPSIRRLHIADSARVAALSLAVSAVCRSIRSA
jgi:hypothetical protein